MTALNGEHCIRPVYRAHGNFAERAPPLRSWCGPDSVRIESFCEKPANGLTSFFGKQVAGKRHPRKAPRRLIATYSAPAVTRSPTEAVRSTNAVPRPHGDNSAVGENITSEKGGGARLTVQLLGCVVAAVVLTIAAASIARASL